MTNVPKKDVASDEWVESLLQSESIVILAPHPDDEVIGTSVLIQRAVAAQSKVTVVFLTIGIPEEKHRSVTNIERNGPMHLYQQQRLHESDAALSMILGLNIYRFSFYSRELHLHMRELYLKLKDIIDLNKPEVILLPAYEGAHPDHDVAHIIGATLAKKARIRAVEYLGYNNFRGQNRYQQFIPVMDSKEYILVLSQEEIAVKRAMLERYATQYEPILKHFSPSIESFRDIPNYNYLSQLPGDKIVYEEWDCGVSWDEILTAIKKWKSGLKGEGN